MLRHAPSDQDADLPPGLQNTEDACVDVCIGYLLPQPPDSDATSAVGPPSSVNGVKESVHVLGQRSEALSSLQIGENGWLSLVDYLDSEHGSHTVSLINWKTLTNALARSLLWIHVVALCIRRLHSTGSAYSLAAQSHTQQSESGC